MTILGAKHYFAEVDHLGSLLERYLGTPSSFFSLAFLSGFRELSSFALLRASCMIFLFCFVVGLKSNGSSQPWTESVKQRNSFPWEPWVLCHSDRKLNGAVHHGGNLKADTVKNQARCLCTATNCLSSIPARHSRCSASSTSKTELIIFSHMPALYIFFKGCRHQYY